MEIDIITNPLKLDKKNRIFYEALVNLYTTDLYDEENWLKAFRKVQTIKKAEPKESILAGWRCFYVNYNKSDLPLELAELYF